MLKNSGFKFEISFERSEIKFWNRVLNLWRLIKQKYIIAKVNEIEQNLMKNFIRYCLLLLHSVNHCRILWKTVNFCHFCKILFTTAKVSVHFYSKFGLKWVLIGFKAERSSFVSTKCHLASFLKMSFNQNDQNF